MQLGLEVSYPLTGSIEIAAGGNNVLDEYRGRSIADVS